MSERTEREPLSLSDRQIVEGIQRGAPDAEIAVRLGIAIPDVKDRIAALQQRFGYESRADLAAIDPEQPPAVVLPGPSEGSPPSPAATSEPDLPPASASEERNQVPYVPGEPAYSRRTVLGMIGVGAATLAGVGAYFVMGSGDTSPAPARQDPFATPTPTATPPPPPTPTPHPGLSALVRDDDAWARHTFTNGQPMHLEHGIGFIDVETGESEVFQFADVDGRETWPNWLYDVSPGNDVVATRLHGGTPLLPRGAVHRRSTRQSFTWDENSLQLVAFNDTICVFQRIRGRGAGAIARHTGIFEVVDTSMQSLTGVELPPIPGGWPYPPAAVSNDNRLIAFQVSGDIHLLNLESKTVSDLPFPTVEGMPAVRAGLEGASGQAGFVLSGSWMQGNYDVVIDGSGDVTSIKDWGDFGRPYESPDGRYWLNHRPLRQVFSDEPESWEYAELLESGGDTALFRVLSGSLSTGTTTYRRWLADSSGFIVDARRRDPALENYQGWLGSVATYVVSTSGEVSPLITSQPASQPLHIRRRGFEPSPANVELFAAGGTLVWDRARNQLLGPGETPPPAHIDPWGANPQEIRFAFPHMGGGWPGWGTMLLPHVERPPFRDEVTLQVARSETCVNFRSAPKLDADILACLLDGTRFTVVSSDAPPPATSAGDPGESPAFLGDPDANGGQMFVHGRLDDGREGWVAVQYLDWAD